MHTYLFYGTIQPGKRRQSMKTFSFTEEELQLLAEILDKEIPSLRDEIVHTDDHDYREFLKEREKRLSALVRKIKESA
jgi:hypothetical protein